MVTDDTIKPLLHGAYTTSTIGRHLCAMINRGYNWVSHRRCRSDGARMYFIQRDGIADVPRHKTEQKEECDENPF